MERKQNPTENENEKMKMMICWFHLNILRCDCERNRECCGRRRISFVTKRKEKIAENESLYMR